MGKTRDLSKKTGDTKGIFHAKMGSIKDWNVKDLTEAADIKKRWQEYTELQKKGLKDLDNPHGVVTHLEPDILDVSPVALESFTTNKASGGDGIPAELFKFLKHDAVKVLHSLCQQIWRTQHWPQDWKSSVFISSPKKGNAKECSNYCAHYSHTQKVTLKILQAKPQQEKAMAPHCSTLTWKIPWTEEPGRLQSMGR